MNELLACCLLSDGELNSSSLLKLSSLHMHSVFFYQLKISLIFHFLNLTKYKAARNPKYKRTQTVIQCVRVCV